MLSPPPPPPVITIDNTELEVVDTFTYLGSTMSSSTSLDAEISCRIAKAAAVMAKLTKQVWGNDLLSERTKMCIHQTCVLLTLLYGSEFWMTYARKEQQLNRFHLCCLRRLLHIRWQARVTNTEVLERAGSLSMPSHLFGELREGIRRMTLHDKRDL